MQVWHECIIYVVIQGRGSGLSDYMNVYEYVTADSGFCDNPTVLGARNSCHYNMPLGCKWAHGKGFRISENVTGEKSKKKKKNNFLAFAYKDKNGPSNLLALLDWSHYLSLSMQRR